MTRQGQVDPESMMYWNDGYGLIAGFFMVIFWLVIIGIAVLVVRWLTTNSRKNNTAEAILDERLARGDISIAEYHERKAALQKR